MRPHRVKGGLCRKVTCRLIPELVQEGAKEDGGESASGLGARDLGAAYLWEDHHLTCPVHSCPWISGWASGGSWPKAGDLSRSWSKPRFSQVWSRLLGLMVFFLFCHPWRLGLSGCRRAHRGGHRGAGPHTVASGGGHPAVQRPLESFCLQEPPHTAPTKRSVLERRCGGLTLTIWSARADVITICFYIQRKCLTQNTPTGESLHLGPWLGVEAYFCVAPRVTHSCP